MSLTVVFRETALRGLARIRSDDFQIGQTVTLAVPAQKCVGLKG